MKETNTKTNYILLIIKSVVIILFAINLITSILKLQHYINATGNLKAILDQFESEYTLISIFLPTLLALIPMVGIFLKNKIGWLFINSYFYFLLTNLLFSLGKLDYKIDNSIIITAIIGISLTTSVLIAMNKNKISHLKYKIYPSVLILYNILAFIIGVSITIFLVYYRS